MQVRIKGQLHFLITFSVITLTLNLIQFLLFCALQVFVIVTYIAIKCLLLWLICMFNINGFNQSYSLTTIMLSLTFLKQTIQKTWFYCCPEYFFGVLTDAWNRYILFLGKHFINRGLGPSSWAQALCAAWL